MLPRQFPPTKIGPPAAFDVVRARKSQVQSWYLDLSMIAQYWGESRVYHHTAPINMSYALYEALRIVAEEGQEAREARHLLNHRALRAGLEAMGLSYIPSRSLPNLNAVHVPNEDVIDIVKALARNGKLHAQLVVE